MQKNLHISKKSYTFAPPNENKVQRRGATWTVIWPIYARWAGTTSLPTVISSRHCPRNKPNVLIPVVFVFVSRQPSPSLPGGGGVSWLSCTIAATYALELEEGRKIITFSVVFFVATPQKRCVVGASQAGGSAQMRSWSPARALAQVPRIVATT